MDRRTTALHTAIHSNANGWNSASHNDSPLCAVEKMKPHFIGLWVAVFMIWIGSLIHIYTTHQKFKALDERMWNVENAQ